MTSPAAAHGFGQRYDLPIPLSFYVWGAGATVALSFVGLALFLRQEPGLPGCHGEWRLNRRLATAVVLAGRLLGVGMLFLVVLAGFFGNQDPVRNIAPVMVWVVGWVALGFLCLLVGDVWALLNPWNAIFAAAERCRRRMHPSGVPGAGRRYPDWLGAWPAVALFLVFAWMELVWSGKTVPAALSAALLIYSAVTWLGMLAFGRETWLGRGEVFTLVFGLFARFAPLAAIPGSPSVLCIRPPAVGLLEHRPPTTSMTVLVVVLLATVTFDGLLETPWWARLDLLVFDAASRAETGFWRMLDFREDEAVRLVRTLGLIAFVLLFLGAYALVALLTATASGENVSAAFIVRVFVLTLVPISLAYHVAHYFSLLFIAGQYAIPLLSDPFGRGWDLFGTAGYRIDIGVVTPRLQWTVAVVAVVLGHLVAVYLSHATALRVFSSRRAALKSQIPMVMLMIGYTMISLWILSQPIVEAGAG